MIRVDRNLQESVSLLPESHLSWQPNDSDFIQRLDPKDQSQLHPPSPAELPRDRSSSLSPAPDTNSPQTQPEAPSSPPLAANAQEKEEPVKVAQREEEEEEETRVEKASRLSTPLSEPPDDLDVTVDPPVDAPSELLAPQKSSETALSSPAVSSVTHLPVSPTSASTDPKSPEHKVISILDLNSELLQVCIEFQKKGIHPTDGLYLQFSQRLQSNLAWLAAIADPNRSMTTVSLPMIDPPPTIDFYPCQRIQQIYTEIPGFFAKEIARRQQLGIPLIIPGSGFIQALNPAHKRERTDDGSPDPVSKRQNTGDAKPAISQLMPPPSSIPSTNSSPTPNIPVSSAAAPHISNGHAGPSPPTATHQHFPQHLPQQSSDAHLMMTQAGMPQQPSLNSQEVQMAASARVRQAQLRMAQQQAMANAKQTPTVMPGASNTSPKGVGPSMALTAPGSGATGQVGHAVGNVNTIAGQHSITYQQALQILQNPNHPIIQYLMRAIPGFQGLSQQVQVQKIATAAFQMQNRNQQSDQQRAAGAGMPNVQQMQNTAGGMSFPMANVNPAHFSGMSMGHQNNAFAVGAQTVNTGAVPGAGGMSGINMNNLNPHQRQLLLMQQQRAGANMAMGNAGMGAGLATGVSGSGSSTMMINTQQMSLSPQQLQQQQQRMGGGMSVNLGSPMSGGANDFAPTLRSNNAIPGIARSARSPSDTSPNPMTPRGGSAVGRGASLGPEDYQRMMMKQQQQQQSQNSQGTIFGTPGGATQGMMGGNWAGQQGGGIAMGQSQGQNQTLQLQGMQMQGGYGMSSPIQAQHQPQQHQQVQPGAAGLGSFIGGVSASPPPMGVSSPNWAGSPTQQQGAGGGGIGGMFSPFSPTGGSLADISRHMSATLGSHQSQTSSLAGSQDDYSGLFDWPS